MFTGIVQAVGRIAATAPGPGAGRLVVACGSLDASDVSIGDSIAVSGCCLTVVGIEREGGESRLAFDVSAETLACTANLDGPGEVNLEKALRLADRLGGHLMTGHVDGVGSVAEVAPDGAGSVRVTVDAPAALGPYIAAKGSISIDGVSLTVNHVEGRRFHVNLIPHTLTVTTLRSLAPGRRVNLEVDLIARYVARRSEYRGQDSI
ncbi:MAG TPA: riboflavin synthase [Casimicrobiaceae bacterium]|jgi:riboflavin synthase